MIFLLREKKNSSKFGIVMEFVEKSRVVAFGLEIYANVRRPR